MQRLYAVVVSGLPKSGLVVAAPLLHFQSRRFFVLSLPQRNWSCAFCDWVGTLQPVAGTVPQTATPGVGFGVGVGSPETSKAAARPRLPRSSTPCTVPLVMPAGIASVSVAPAGCVAGRSTLPPLCRTR